MKIVLIAALDDNRGMGYQGALPWHLPEDLRHFKRVTMGHAVIFGRRTFESLPTQLRGRTVLVLSRTVSQTPTLDAALEAACGHGKVFIAGGSAVYAEALDRCLPDELILTRVHGNFPADTYFPLLPAAYTACSEQTTHTSVTGLEFSILRYERGPICQTKL